MFDRVRCEIPLPDGFAGEMQTKDFDCVLSTLLIRADGRLMIEECDWEECRSKSGRTPDFSSWDRVEP